MSTRLKPGDACATCRESSVPLSHNVPDNERSQGQPMGKFPDECSRNRCISLHDVFTTVPR